jgi:hypothetical protein
MFWIYLKILLIYDMYRVASTYFKNVANFKYLGMTVTNQNYVHADIKSRSNTGNSCYHLTPKNTVILPWPLALREKYKIKGV